jgi:poly(beta-D-mannuronate) lyase
MGNVAAATGAGARAGLRIGDLKLERGRNGLWRPTLTNLIRSAEGSFAFAKTDMDGQPRHIPVDIGSDQVSTAPVTRHPLSAAEVGPAWMDARIRSAQ